MTIPADIAAAIDALATAPRASARGAHAALVAAIRAHLSAPLTVGLDAAIRHVRLARVTAAAIGHSADYMAALDRTVDGLSAMRDRGGPAASKVCELATPPLTVGAALARPEVQDGSHVVEYADCFDANCSDPDWLQVRISGPVPSTIGVRIFSGRGWKHGGGWRPWACDIAATCRLVPADEADLDPTTRSKP